VSFAKNAADCFRECNRLRRDVERYRQALQWMKAKGERIKRPQIVQVADRALRRVDPSPLKDGRETSWDEIYDRETEELRKAVFPKADDRN
jgi:hypothetical protein